MKKQQKSSEWVWPPARWWFGSGFPTMTILMLVISALSNVTLMVVALLTQFAHQHAMQIWGTGACLSLLGAALICYAKLPLYRQRRFTTFGSAAISEIRRPFYRWGYRLVFTGCGLLLLLIPFRFWMLP